MRPSDFGLCEPEEDVGVMIAYSTAEGIMRAWENQKTEDKLNETRRKGSRKGR